MDHWTEHFFKTTAIYAGDIVRKGELPHPVAVKYCPVNLDNYTGRFSALEDNDTSSEKEQYIAKAVQFVKGNLGEVKEYIEVPEEKAIEVVVDAINSGWADILGGNTVGFMGEAVFSKGAGGVVGCFFAFDKTGFSLIGWIGMSAGIAMGLIATVGGFFYPGPREGLTGFGGDFNVSAAILGKGVEWEAMFTGGRTGFYSGRSTGAGLALSVEFQRAWTIAEWVL